ATTCSTVIFGPPLLRVTTSPGLNSSATPHPLFPEPWDRPAPAPPKLPRPPAHRHAATANRVPDERAEQPCGTGPPRRGAAAGGKGGPHLPPAPPGREEAPLVGPVPAHLTRRAVRVEVAPVPYEFQRGGNRMLRLTRA